jgi:hypothetical protein
MPTNSTERPEIVYGAEAIGAEINEKDERRVYYKLAKGYIPGAWKAGNTWALTVPVFRRAVGLDSTAA